MSVFQLNITFFANLYYAFPVFRALKDEVSSVFNDDNLIIMEVNVFPDCLNTVEPQNMKLLI